MSAFDDLSNEYELSKSKAGKNSRGVQLRGNIGELMFKHLIKLGLSPQWVKPSYLGSILKIDFTNH